jgi:drug/metabolite transporter (DMT)-like permease
MISWLFVIILAYFFFSLASLADKLILNRKQDPVVYTFYVGFFNIFVALFIPFINFALPDAKTFLWIIAEAGVYLSGLYLMYIAINKFDVSKVVTTIGATQPILIFIFTWIFFGTQIISSKIIFAFAILLIGSILISGEKNIKLSSDYLKITLLASLMFSLDYIFSKLVFSNMTFWQGFIWMRIFIFLFSLLFLISIKNRKIIFTKKVIADKKVGVIFGLNQMFGGGANILQSFAIFLAPAVFLPIINSLRGIQYVFLFLLTLFFSIFLPKILKEEMSKPVIIRKTISIILIAVGLALLVL